MPLLAALIKAGLGWVGGLLLAVVQAQIAARLAAVAVLAGMYVAALTVFSVFIAPLLGALFSTTYGQVLGLAFPPVAGTVCAGIVALWVALVTKNYAQRFVRVAVG
jgi:hypothetical protein